MTTKASAHPIPPEPAVRAVAAPAATAAEVPGAARDLRLRAVKDMKRQMILDAARRVFEKDGLLGANMRAIAAEAGYTAGALYNHYASKEEIYGDLLSQSLDRLNASVEAASRSSAAPAKRVEQHALGFYDFYLAHPRELDLGFYLFQGMQPLGLSPELNQRLNLRLREALSGIEDGLLALGCERAQATRETTSLFAHCVGLLLLTHTGRIRMFGQDGRTLFQAYVRKLIQQVNP